jgi:hypothetical protein
MRYFEYAHRFDGCNGWEDIVYIGFHSVGEGTICFTDGTTKGFYHDLKGALEAVADGTWVEVFPGAQQNDGARIDLDVDPSWLDDLRNGSWDVTVDQDDDRDFLVTATVQVIVRAEDRVIARLIAAETLRDYIADSPYPNDVMNGLTIDDVEDLMEQD